MAYLNLLLHAFAADKEGQPCAVCQANKAAVSCTDAEERHHDQAFWYTMT